MVVHSYRSITRFGFTDTELLNPATSHRTCPAEVPANDHHFGQFRSIYHIRACNRVQSSYIGAHQCDRCQGYLPSLTDSSTYICPDPRLRELFCIREVHL